MISGSVSEFDDFIISPSGSIFGHPMVVSTGSLFPNTYSAKLSADSIDIEGLWQKMYEQPPPVIFVCAYCKCHNALGNSACVQCGAPLGYAKRR